MTEKQAEDLVLRWCRKRGCSTYRPVMRVRKDGTHVVVDVAHWSRPPVAIGQTWAEVLRHLPQN